MPARSVASPIRPPSASISLTRLPLARPPMAGLHDMRPMASRSIVTMATRAPPRAQTRAASAPAWPPPMTMMSKFMIVSRGTFQLRAVIPHCIEGVRRHHRWRRRSNRSIRPRNRSIRRRNRLIRRLFKSCRTTISIVSATISIVSATQSMASSTASVVSANASMECVNPGDCVSDGVDAVRDGALSLPDAEFREDLLEDVVAGDGAGEQAERGGGAVEIDEYDLLLVAFVERRERGAQRTLALGHGHALALIDIGRAHV